MQIFLYLCAMKSKIGQIFIRIATWLGILLGLTIVAVLLWQLIFHGSQTTASLKWLQCLQTIATFLLPPILCALIWDADRRPFSWLKMDQPVHWEYLLWGFGIMICALPAINFLADLNSRLQLPESLDFIEQFLRQQEDNAAALTQRFLQADNIGVLFINIALMALLPALSEELSFRGTLQQIISNKSQITNNQSTIHVAVWVTAIVFSAIHMQFYGFIPRMLLGAMLGYAFVWTGSLWVPILMHFTNNAVAVIAYYLSDDGQTADSINYADTFGAGTTWYIGLISLVITCLGLLIFYRRTHKQ